MVCDRVLTSVCRGGNHHHDTASKRRSDFPANRPAFTVLELLVVMAVIAIVCALILPAVQHAREAARQVQCKNNLHQIGLALQSYHATANCLPPGWILEMPISNDSQNGWGWLAMVLPQMDQASLYNSINFKHHLGNNSNSTARLTSVGAFICGSDRVPLQFPFYLGGEHSGMTLTHPHQRGADLASIEADDTRQVLFEVAGASYAGVHGVEDPPDDLFELLGKGVFGLNSALRFGDLSDGASQTLIAGERSARHIATTWTGMHPAEEEGAERIIGFVIHSPNHPEADEAEYSSRHPGGAHFLIGDGSVRFINDHIDTEVFRAMATRSGSELIGREKF